MDKKDYLEEAKDSVRDANRADLVNWTQANAVMAVAQALIALVERIDVLTAAPPAEGADAFAQAFRPRSGLNTT